LKLNKTKINKNISINLSVQIKKAIGYRILICFILAISFVFAIAIDDIFDSLHQLELNLASQCANLETFIISQVLVQNEEAIQPKLDELNQKSVSIKFIWKETASAGLRRKLFWRFPFSWVFYYPITNIDNSKLGVLIVTGPLLYEQGMFSNLFTNLTLILLLFAIIFVVLFPLGNRIPQQLFIAPINNLLFLLRNGKSNIESESLAIMPEEINEIREKIISLLKEVENRSREAALGQIATQVAHDIRSPVSAILMLSKECIEVPENQRTALRDAANRIQDIANYLLSQYGNPMEESKEIEPFLASTAILSVLSEKRIEYQKSAITFSYSFIKDACFAFIQANLIEFKRMISNIINNAVDAIAGRGEIIIRLMKDETTLTIQIIDNGKGMAEELIKQILNNERILSQKASGHGFGLTHARKILKQYNADLKIISTLNKGTEINFIFRTVPSPVWITDSIDFYADDCIIVLDDDASIHCAWDGLFTSVVEKNPKLKLVHFSAADKCIEYIKGFADKRKMLLLADFELIKQSMNGLDVIEITEIERAILVTSHYENKDIITRSILLNVKLLPKVLASDVKLNLLQTSLSIEENKEVDLIVLEDNQEFSDVLAYLYKSRGKNITIFHTPYQLLKGIKNYSRHTKICLDYNINCPVSGVDLATVLYNKGYKNLYIATGYQLQQVDLPSYVILLKEKMELLQL